MSRAQRAHHATLRPLDFKMLHEVEAEHVSWRQDAIGRRSYRHWSDEHTYTTCTPRLKRLSTLGFIECQMAAGYTYALKGPVVLSAKGRRAVEPVAADTGGE